MNILSIHYGHDSSVCILKNGEIFLYFKEERFSRQKRDTIPFLSIKKCLECFDEEIDHVIVTSTENSIMFQYIVKFVSCFIKIKNIHDFTFTHHLTHIGTSFFNSGFEESIVVVVDGRGSFLNYQVSECESLYVMSYKNGVRTILKNYFDPSYIFHDPVEEKTIDEIENNQNFEGNVFGKVGGITNLYSASCLLIGQEPLDGGKLMGLSSYGKKIKNFPKLFENKEGKIEKKYFDMHNFNRADAKDINFKMPIFKEYKEKVVEKITNEIYEFYSDYAYVIQTQTQEAVGTLIEKAIKKTGIKKVCISGGYGMNIVANYYYLQRFPDVEFYFEPLADDTGGSIGAAKMFWHYNEGYQYKSNNSLKTTSFHGIKYDVTSYKGKTTTVKEISNILHQNKSVAVYTGLAEAGQRALGNRSIFFNALNPNAKNIVNKIKKREWYRPFACIVLEEDADIYFNMGRIKSSPYMTVCFPVREKYVKIIPGVTHVDNTCRIQTVSNADEYLYELLQEFKKLSGHGILLNTSFNLAGHPLVETPEDALNTLNNSCLDYLWFEETQQILEKEKLTKLIYT